MNHPYNDPYIRNTTRPFGNYNNSQNKFYNDDPYDNVNNLDNMNRNLMNFQNEIMKSFFNSLDLDDEDDFFHPFGGGHNRGNGGRFNNGGFNGGFNGFNEGFNGGGFNGFNGGFNGFNVNQSSASEGFFPDQGFNSRRRFNEDFNNDFSQGGFNQGGFQNNNFNNHFNNEYNNPNQTNFPNQPFNTTNNFQNYTNNPNNRSNTNNTQNHIPFNAPITYRDDKIYDV